MERKKLDIMQLFHVVNNNDCDFYFILKYIFFCVI